MNQASLLFKEELGQIKLLDIKSFTEAALDTGSEAFVESVDVIERTRKGFKVLIGLLDMMQAEGHVRDSLLSALLISDISLHDMDPSHIELHPFAVRLKLKEVFPSFIAKDLFEIIMKAVESHEGAATPIKSLVPNMGKAEFIVAMAFEIVDMNGIEVKL